MGFFPLLRLAWNFSLNAEFIRNTFEELVTKAEILTPFTWVQAH